MILFSTSLPLSEWLNRKVREVAQLQDCITELDDSFPHFLHKLPHLICQNTQKKRKEKKKKSQETLVAHVM